MSEGKTEVKEKAKYQLMPSLSEKEYEALKRSIEEDGVLLPIEFDGEGNVLDGHHRLKICEELGIEDYPSDVKVGFETEEEKKTYIRRINLARRHLNENQKEKLIKGQLKDTTEKSNRLIAKMLGVDKNTVQNYREDLESTGEIHQLDKLEGADGKKRPAEKETEADKSFQKSEKKPKTIPTRTKKEKEKAVEVAKKAKGGDEKAKEEVNKIDEDKTSVNTAHKNVEKEEAEKKVEKQKDTGERKGKIYKEDAVEFLNQIDEKSVDLLITDPPYKTELEDVESFANFWVEKATSKIKDDGYGFIFIGAYPNELETYLSIVNKLSRFDVEVLVWTYKNIIGQMPKSEYKLNWQAILFLRGKETEELDCPKTSEQWAVQEVNAPDARNGERYHRWEKPKELIGRFIRHTTRENDKVLDIFAGTGTHIIKAGELGREAFGCDNDEEMLEIADERGCIIDG